MPAASEWRFFNLLAILLLAGCAGYAAAVLHSSPWAEARQLDAIFPFYKWRTRPYSAPELARAWQTLSLGAGVAAVAFLLFAVGPLGRTVLKSWMGELSAAFQGLKQEFWALPARHKRIVAWSFAALTLLRGYMSLPSVTPEYDDVPSYELFASKSLLAVSAYYPVPNNHVLSNTLSWAFYHINPGFWFTMRLPVVLAATGATVLLFVGLLRFKAGFRVAGLATMLFSLAQLSLYNGAVGRGYWLLTAFAGVVFFCTLALRNSTQFPLAAWTGLVVASVLGTYTVPTFALVIASAFSWVGLGFLRTKSWGLVAALVFMGLVVVAASLLLYSPLLFVSGPAIFFNNGFVTSHPWGEFWRGLPAYLWETEGFLAGQMKVGAVLVIACMAATATLYGQARKGRLPTGLAPWQVLVPAALWFMWLPYAVLAAQRVFAPSRTLLYKAFFWFLLVAFVVEWLLRLGPVRAQRWLRPTLAVLALGWTTYQFTSLWRDNQGPRQRNQARHEAFLWLARQPSGPMLVPESTHSLFMRMYLHAERPGQTWRLDAFPVPGTAYAYVLAFPEKRGFFQPGFSFPPAFHNDQVDIYRLPAPKPGQAQQPPISTYWHIME